MTEAKEELQLQIQTVDFIPAVVTFNVAQISSVLDAQLAKYVGLEFTEDDEAAAKKTVAELNKGKKLLDTYRKDMKAKLTISVTEFENQIKDLAAKFDAVIIPLTEQTVLFETNRKANKRAEIQAIVIALILEYQLDTQFAPSLTFPDEYLNRSTSIKSIQLELRAKAGQLRNDQDRLASELELIRGKVEIANLSLTGGGLLETTYTGLLGPLPLQQVLARIADDAAALIERETQAAAKIAAAEAAKQKALEAAAIAKLEEPPVQSPPTAAPSVSIPIPVAPSIPEAHLGPDVRTSPQQAHAAEPLYEEMYKVSGTTQQLEAIEAYLNQLGCTWEIIE